MSSVWAEVAVAQDHDLVLGHHLMLFASGSLNKAIP